MKVLITGGVGYIGSHTCVELLQQEYEIVVVDSLVNSNVEALKRVEKITGKEIPFHEIDLRDAEQLDKVFAQYSFDAVIHFAGLKAVGESVVKPLLYYQNNIGATLSLCEVMQKYNVKNIVFSSSATVYGEPETVPITEESPVKTTNPYGTAKLVIEMLLSDIYRSSKDWNVILLRYFNPVGAHPSGLIGEDPHGIPNNLMPYISQVAVGRLKKLFVFGNDYATRDGTGVRDYIHVVDLARGHIAALQRLSRNPGRVIYNLGTGRGYSVLEMIQAFEKASGKAIPYKIVDRRPGDVAECYADPSKAQRELNWQTRYDINGMCRDSWNWQSRNPEGYE